jgi:two-component system, sensor histidine kinase
LIDIGLPGVDGWTVARQLREHFGQSILLIAVTGYVTDEDFRRSREAGFDVHVPKGGNPDMLLGFIRAWSSR